MLSLNELKHRKAGIQVPGNHEGCARMGRPPWEGGNAPARACSGRDWHSLLKGPAERAPSEPTRFGGVSLLSAQRENHLPGMQSKSTQGGGWLPGLGLPQSELQLCLRSGSPFSGGSRMPVHYPSSARSPRDVTRAGAIQQDMEVLRAPRFESFL